MGSNLNELLFFHVFVFSLTDMFISNNVRTAQIFLFKIKEKKEKNFPRSVSSLSFHVLPSRFWKTTAHRHAGKHDQGLFIIELLNNMRMCLAE